MLIVNLSDTTASWFCFNQSDGVKIIALGSGDLSANGSCFSYQAPPNDNSLYYVRYTHQGGGNELAGGTVNNCQIVELVGTGGAYRAVVADPPPP
jgi:hypothetical protein